MLAADCYCTLMVLLLEKFLPVLSEAFTVIKCLPDVMGPLIARGAPVGARCADSGLLFKASFCS